MVAWRTRSRVSPGCRGRGGHAVANVGQLRVVSFYVGTHGSPMERFSDVSTSAFPCVVANVLPQSGVVRPALPRPINKTWVLHSSFVLAVTFHRLDRRRQFAMVPQVRRVLR